LTDYARQQGISYRTAWRWYKAGKIQGQQIDTGTILITEAVSMPEHALSSKVAVYTRVSSAENMSNLESQAEPPGSLLYSARLSCEQSGERNWSGVNDNRPKFLALLADPSIGRIVIEHKDRGTHFGFRYVETLLNTYRRTIEVVNQADNNTEDLLADFTSAFYSFCTRLYGQRRAKRKTEKLTQELQTEVPDLNS
jgi:predicted site-specific integrase-resolvase